MTFRMLSVPLLCHSLVAKLADQQLVA